MINTDRPRLCLAVFCLGALCTPAHAAGGAPSPVRIEIGYTADDNVNRGADTKQKLSDDIFSASLSQSAIFPLTDRTRVVVTGLLTAEKLRRLVGLDRISLGIQGEFQYRTSGEFFAPTFGFVG